MLSDYRVNKVKGYDLKVGDLIVYFDDDFFPINTSPITFITFKGSWMFVCTEFEEKGGWHCANEFVDVYRR